ncbi:MAG: hypothetical protein ACT4OV_11510 [Microthrixaceae bacterium]
MDVFAPRHRHRRVIGLVLALVTVASLGTPVARASDNGLRPAMLDVTGWTRVASPTLAGTTLAGPALPGPSAGNGVGPGSYLIIDQTDKNSYLCTANFVWRDPSGKKYLGAAGHCFLRSGDEVAPGSPGSRVEAVSVCVASCLFGGQLGTVITGDIRPLGAVVYARQAIGRVNVGNDFGLVEIPANLNSFVHHGVPVWGGPTAAAAIGEDKPVCLYGNAAGLGEVFATKARAGLGASTYPLKGSWYANIPSFKGDSGSALVNCPGLSGTTAVGILTHLASDGSGVVAGTTVARARQMANEVGLSITLATV